MALAFNHPTPQDAIEWVALMMEPDVIAGLGPEFARMTLPDLITRFRYLGAIPHSSSWFTVRHDSGEFVGFCGLSRVPVEESNDAFDIFAAVAPSHRRQGIGRAMVREMARRAKEAGARAVASTFANNESGQNCALSAGLRVLALTPRMALFVA